MYINIAIAILSGLILGTITGITPGIHINLIASLIVAYSYYILEILDPITITLTITAMAVTHTILDIIPTTVLGIPNTDNLTMLLPAHKLTSEGKAKIAIVYGIIGSVCGILITIILSPAIIKVIPVIYEKIKDYIAFILIAISAYIILKNKNKFLSLLFFLTSGIIGILSFNIKTIDQPLLPLLSGLFGVSALILSIKNNTKIPEQKEVSINIENKDIAKYTLTTFTASLLTNFLPGLTSSHTALLANRITKVKDQAEYIILANAAGSSATIISFIAFYTIDKARSGAVATIQYLINSINTTLLILVFSVSLISVGIATFTALKISDKILRNINKINYTKISIFIIGLIVSLVLIITGLEGLLILVTAVSLGILAYKLEIEKINITGCLIVPVIIYLI